MSAIAAIRTNKWTDEEERLLSALRPIFGNDLVVVFHDRPKGVVLPVDVVDVSDEWVQRNGLFLVPDWGWRCGDYFYYSLRAARPGYDHYWLVEPDVLFTSPPSAFFGAFEDASADALGYKLGPFPDTIRFTRGLPGVAHSRAIFALTRFSGRALDRLFERRRTMATGENSVRDYPNDEIFAFSHCANDPDLAVGRLEDHAPDWFDGVQFTPDPDLLFDAVLGTVPQGRVLHPVRGREGFKRALAKRLSGHTGFVMRMREAIDLLEPEEVDEIAAMAADRIRDAITQLQRQRAQRRRRQERLA